MVTGMSTITKQYITRKHSSTKLNPIQASLKENERFAYKNLFDDGKKNKPIYRIGDCVRTADSKKTLSKEDTTNCSYNLYENREFVIDTIPRYRVDNLPERCNEALLKKNRVNNGRK